MNTLESKIKKALKTYLKVKERISFYNKLEDKVFAENNVDGSDRLLDKITRLFAIKRNLAHKLMHLLDKFVLVNNSSGLMCSDFKTYQKAKFVDGVIAKKLFILD